MIKLGSNNIGKVYYGSNSIGKAYLGSNLVFQKGSSPTPVLTMLYENSEAITSWTDTGVKLFDPPINWTILCDATCDNYGWNTTSHYDGIFGISPNSQAFRLGKINSAQRMLDNEVIDTGNWYYALSMYNSAAKCISLYPRNNGSLRRKVAIRYNSTTKKLEAVTTGDTDFSLWYTADVPTTSSNVILLVGGITATIHDIKIYQGLMDDASMIAYVQ